jgi:Tfp pilus assembly protein PilN
MNGRNMDLRPDSVRRRVESAREKTHLRNMSVVAAVMLTLAWSTGAWRLSDARAEHALATAQAEETIRVEQELAQIQLRFDEAGQALSAWRRCSIPFGASLIVASIVNDLPESGTIERIDLDAGALSSAPVRGARSRTSKPAARRITAEIEGFTASDDDVALFVEALRRRPLLKEVRVETTRHRTIGEETARAFRIAFEIDLETASPVLEPIGIVETEE